VLKGDDTDAIQKAHEKLMKDAQVIGKVIYEQTAKHQAAAGGGPGAPGGDGFGGAGQPGGGQSAPQDDVIDAEYEVKK
jgi:hypothetical protein